MRDKDIEIQQRYNEIAMENVQGETSRPKLPKIKIFQTIQRNFGQIGIGPESSMQLRPFKTKILAVSLLLGIGIFSILMHISTEAKSFLDVAESTYECSVLILEAFVMIGLALRSNKLFETIRVWECLINTRKWSNWSEVIEGTLSDFKAQHSSNDFLSII